MMRYLTVLLCLLGFGVMPAQADSMAACDNVIRAGNETWAYKNCLPAAEDGKPKAQVIIGMALMTGVGVLKNPDLAVSWFKRAADQNYPAGMYQLGLAKVAGMGTAQDEAGGMALVKKAASAGDPEAKSFLLELGIAEEPEKPVRKRIKNDCVGVGCGRPLDPFPK
ncbi:MAG: tetratricopeptide repeat protein [Fluviibacter sp.]